MRMRLSLKHDTCYAQHFAELYSEPCQASEMELFAKTVNELMLFAKTVNELMTKSCVQNCYCKKVLVGCLTGFLACL